MALRPQIRCSKPYRLYIYSTEMNRIQCWNALIVMQKHAAFQYSDDTKNTV